MKLQVWCVVLVGVLLVYHSSADDREMQARLRHMSFVHMPCTYEHGKWRYERELEGQADQSGLGLRIFHMQKQIVGQKELDRITTPWGLVIFINGRWIPTNEVALGGDMLTRGRDLTPAGADTKPSTRPTALDMMADAVRGLSAKDPQVHAMAVQLIRNLQSAAGPVAAQALGNAIMDHPAIAEYALQALREMGRGGKPALDTIRICLIDQRATVRQAAARALAAVVDRPEQAIRDLTPLLNDPDPGVRAAAQQALARLMPATQPEKH